MLCAGHFKMVFIAIILNCMTSRFCDTARTVSELVFVMVFGLVLGLAAVQLELNFHPGIRTGFLKKIGVFRASDGAFNLPEVLLGYCWDTAGRLFLLPEAFHSHT